MSTASTASPTPAPPPTAASPKPEPPVVLYLDHTAKWSGGEIALLRTLEALDRSRVTPVVVLAEDGPLAERTRALGLETHVLPLDPSLRDVRRAELGGGLGGKLKTGFRFAAYAGQIARFARKRGARLLHCNSLKADIYGLVAGRLARVPVLWHVRDHIDPSYLPARVVTLMRGLAARGPRYVLTNSQSTLEKLFPAGANVSRADWVHDGLTDGELTTPPPPVAVRFKNHPPRIGIVGRFAPWKGQHVFLDAAQRLTEQGHEARYVLIGAPLFGETEYEASLKQQASRLGDRVEFTGFQKDVPALLRTLDILVHASTTPEPFGQVIIEGMAEGLPVVATDGGGAREIVADGKNGLLTPMGDADALAAALVTLLSDPAEAGNIARAGYHTVRERFTAAHNARKIEAAYARIGVMKSSPSGAGKQ